MLRLRILRLAQPSWDRVTAEHEAHLFVVDAGGERKSIRRSDYDGRTNHDGALCVEGPELGFRECSEHNEAVTAYGPTCPVPRSRSLLAIHPARISCTPHRGHKVCAFACCLFNPPQHQYHRRYPTCPCQPPICSISGSRYVAY